VKLLKKSVCLLCLLSMSFNSLEASSNSYLFKSSDYQPTINLSLKGGHQRSIGRVGGVIPLYGMNDNLWFTQIWGLWDSEAAKEWNVGLGYRQRLDNIIIGTYGLFDRRLSSVNQYYSQITLGAELLGHHLEGRINGYIPTTSAKVVGGQVDESHRVSLVWADLLEHPLGGIDIDIGGHLLSYQALEGFITYYHFNGQRVKAINGIRVRAQFHINHYVTLTGEMSHDRLRKRSWFAGMQLEFRVGGMKQAKGLSKKMTQMVIRDIDVITDISKLNGLEIRDFTASQSIRDKIDSIIVIEPRVMYLKPVHLKDNHLIPVKAYDIKGLDSNVSKDMLKLLADQSHWRISTIGEDYGITISGRCLGGAKGKEEEIDSDSKRSTILGEYAVNMQDVQNTTFTQTIVEAVPKPTFKPNALGIKPSSNPQNACRIQIRPV